VRRASRMEERKKDGYRGVLPMVEFWTFAWFKAEEAPEDMLECIKRRTGMKLM
jgi:hypothetical protein